MLESRLTYQILWHYYLCSSHSLERNPHKPTNTSQVLDQFTIHKHLPLIRCYATHAGEKNNTAELAIEERIMTFHKDVERWRLLRIFWFFYFYIIFLPSKWGEGGVGEDDEITKRVSMSSGWHGFKILKYSTNFKELGMDSTPLDSTSKPYTGGPPYPRVIRSKIYRGYVKLRIIPNASYKEI